MTKTSGLDYGKVDNYWNETDPSILGPYMMDGFGFPLGAGRFRFRAESKIAQELLRDVNRSDRLLDLGSGIGYWAKHFAKRFGSVIAVEKGAAPFRALEARCSRYANITTVQGDVRSFHHQHNYDVVFLGGMLMYLNDADAISLLRGLAPYVSAEGIILCRETTVRDGVITREGEYQAVYRSVSTYRRLFKECGLIVDVVQLNEPYVLMQMGCELIKWWKGTVPMRLQCVPVVGRLVYWGLRLVDPWIIRVPGFLGLSFPELTNHFFVLRKSETESNDNKSSTASIKVAQGEFIAGSDV